MRNLLVAAGTATLLVAGGLSAQAATMSPAAKATDAGPVIQNSNAVEAMDQGDMAHTSIRQQIQDQLAKTGYTNIKIMPSSFYVRAMDKKGDPVSMVIGPDSFTAVTEIAPKTASTAAPPPATAPSSPVATPKT